MSKIIFFDINGTIIKRDERTDIPYQKAVDLFFNITDGMKGVETSARSDKDVFMEILERQDQQFSEEKWQLFLTIYEKQLRMFASTDIWRENVDAVEFIKELAKKGEYKLSLITGELSIGARYKLKKLGIWHCFNTGGFGEDGLQRFGIARKALSKAEDYYQRKFDELFIIGDTILDIRTARHLKAKIISITTGSNTAEELKQENPDFLINKFSEIKDLFLS